VGAAARDLGLTEFRPAQLGGADASGPRDGQGRGPTSVEREELGYLRKEVRELRTERNVIKTRHGTSVGPRANLCE
jgi:hypothetical protein